MGFSAFWFSQHCHLNHEVSKMFLKIHKTFKQLSVVLKVLESPQFFKNHNGTTTTHAGA